MYATHFLSSSNAGLGIAAERQRSSLGEAPELYPADLLNCPELNECDGSWWLAHTKPRQEKALASDLCGAEVAFYLPLILRKSLTRGRTRVSRIPLFPGYVFLHGDDSARLQALKTNRVLTATAVADGERLRSQLQRFWDLIAKGAPLVRESRLCAGERVRLKAGPFRGTEGVVLRRDGKTKLLVAIDFLQQGASIEVDDCMLEPVD